MSDLNSPSPRPTPADVTMAETMAEHERIQELRAAMSSSTDLRVLSTVLTELLNLLPEHFAKEEGPDGTRRFIIDHAPRLIHRADVCLEEHGTVLECARAVREQLQDCLQAVADLTRRIDAHEHEERELYQEALFTDIGSSE